MGLFNNVFGSKSEPKESKPGISWIPLQSDSQLAELIEKSSSQTQIIFKHSTTCGISGMVLRLFSNTSLEANQADFYLLDIHSHRDISNNIAETFGVVHQSPQLLLIKEGNVVYNTSHGAIADVNLQKYL